MEGEPIKLNLSEPDSNMEFAEFIQPRNRLDLVACFNNTFGVPCEAVKDMQMDFIYGRMEPWQTISFVKVCRAYIKVATMIACEEYAQQSPLTSETISSNDSIFLQK